MMCGVPVTLDAKRLMTFSRLSPNRDRVSTKGEGGGPRRGGGQQDSGGRRKGGCSVVQPYMDP